MAFIRIIEPAEATGDLRVVYDEMKARPLPAYYTPPHGGVAGIQRIHSLDPDLIRVTFAATGTRNEGTELTLPERELVSTVASRVNQCLY